MKQECISPFRHPILFATVLRPSLVSRRVAKLAGYEAQEKKAFKREFVAEYLSIRILKTEESIAYLEAQLRGKGKLSSWFWDLQIYRTTPQLEGEHRKLGRYTKARDRIRDPLHSMPLIGVPFQLSMNDPYVIARYLSHRYSAVAVRSGRGDAYRIVDGAIQRLRACTVIAKFDKDGSILTRVTPSKTSQKTTA